MIAAAQLLRALLVVACCVAAVAQAASSPTMVIFKDLTNTTVDMSTWSETDGVATKMYLHSFINYGAFTIKGNSARFNTARVSPAQFQVDNITLDKGYIVVTGYLPLGSSLTLSRFRGTVAANTPLLDASAMMWENVSVVLKNSAVEWASTETTTNTQVPLSIASRMAIASSIFVLNTTATQASAIVAVGTAATASGVYVNGDSIVAIDYTNCSGCTNGLLYAGALPLLIQSSSMLRVSHSSATNVAAATPLVNVGTSNTLAISGGSLVVMENISALDNNLFAASAVTTSGESAVVLRYVTAYGLGATLSVSASYKMLTLTQSAGAALSAAVAIADDACAAACMPGATVDNTCSCVCPTSTEDGVRRYMNYCTYVSDVMLAQYPATCGAGCAACSSASTCTTCKAGYTLISGVCYQPPTACAANCAQCASNGVCQTCADGYALSSSKTCDACTASHCATCTTSLSTCSTCLDGYSMLGTACTPSCVVSNCASCMPTNNAQCVGCVSGYTVTQAGTCKRDGDAAAGQPVLVTSMVALLLLVILFVA